MRRLTVLSELLSEASAIPLPFISALIFGTVFCTGVANSESSISPSPFVSPWTTISAHVNPPCPR
jgi:hypothetical protein